MRAVTSQAENSDRAQIVRYVVNGLVATAVHFVVLTTNLHVFDMRSAGVANLYAAVVGISVSFLGSRYFVFRKRDQTILRQASKFGVLYVLIACLHGTVLYGWSDACQLDYRIGFLLATALQMVLSYWGNKMLVFKA